MSNPSQTNNYKQNQISNIQTNILTAREARIKNAEMQNAETIKHTTEEINRLAGEDKVVIPENIFVRYFLPYFAQEEGMYPPTAHEEWLKISKNGMMPVTVINENGESVIDVPPRYSRSLINIRSKRDRIPLSEAMATFSELAVSSPIRARNYFDNVIHPKTGTSDDKQLAKDRYNVAMDNVLTHYGKKTGLSNSKIDTSSNENEKPKTIYTEDDLL